MEWGIIAGLAGLTLLLIQMYRFALREGRALTNYALLMLVDEGVYAAQRASLVAFVRASKAKNAAELGGEAYLASGRLAGKLSHTVLGVNGLLWKLKDSQTP